LRRLQKTPIVSSFAREGPWNGRGSGLPVLGPGPGHSCNPENARARARHGSRCLMSFADLDWTRLL
jgi:hypothetical protein